MNQNEINDFWSEDAGVYDTIIQEELKSFRHAAWQKQILSHFPEGKVLRILDIGCGPAFFSIILSEKGHDVTGVDGADGMLKQARKNVENCKSTATIMKMDANYLDFPDETFDLIVSRNVTHTILNHVTAYKEWKRVLKKGGILLIYDANWHWEETRPDIKKQFVEDWRSCIRTFGSDYNGNTDPDGPAPVDECIQNHPLGDLVRPDYDCGILKALDFTDVQIQRDITQKLWDEKERLLYKSTPMFEISAIKA